MPSGDPHPPQMATAVSGTHPTGMHSCCHMYFITAGKQSLGQGNVFTSVCHSVHTGGESVSRRGLHPGGSASGDLHPGGSAPRGQVCIRRGVGQTPSPSDTTEYSQRAGGSDLTGMHSCLHIISLEIVIKVCKVNIVF